MDRVELKNWAKKKVEGKRWSLLPALIVALIITNFSIITGKDADTGVYNTISIGWIFFFVEIGLVYFMVKFINDEKYEFNDIFHFSKDFVKALVTSLLMSIFIFLWTLLLIIPGIMKFYSYALVSMLMADEKYKDVGYMDILKKSQEIMQGHRMDLFILSLSFIGWHFLAIFTLGLLELWIVPYQKTAETKFLYDVKTAYEGNN